jgi:uncharacterized protein
MVSDRRGNGMKLHAERVSQDYIQSATDDSVLIGGRSYTLPLIIGAGRIVTGWAPRPIAELQLDDFQTVLELEPEVILFGTGRTHQFASIRLMTAIMSRGVGFEVMTNDAACRTYNILAAEDRRVVAALLPVPQETP